ncbi:hypothetical protein ACUTAF_01960 [Pseudomonas sp. SP16.1]|uniref:hypothetical protein n=1 Tax=Pseudomonas sp. SP16.1 TaxID=3458854 RepID=UPI0040466724
MQPTVETLQGELLALRCHIAALMEVQPLSSQLRFRAKLETALLLIRPCQSGDRQEGFDRAVVSLMAKRTVERTSTHRQTREADRQ